MAIPSHGLRDPALTFICICTRTALICTYTLTDAFSISSLSFFHLLPGIITVYSIKPTHDHHHSPFIRSIICLTLTLPFLCILSDSYPFLSRSILCSNRFVELLKVGCYSAPSLPFMFYLVAASRLEFLLSFSGHSLRGCTNTRSFIQSCSACTLDIPVIWMICLVLIIKR